MPPVVGSTPIPASLSHSSRWEERTRRNIVPACEGTQVDHSSMTIALVVNGRRRVVDAADDTPLLWVLRDDLGLTGTKFGCGIGACGACMVHVDGAPLTACVTPLSAVAGRDLTTIEGLSPDGSHAVQRAWIAEDVPQCGYCQTGQIMSAVALLRSAPRPTDADIDRAMDRHICRCGTYARIRLAIHRAASEGR
jgi:isoquinoline 1-oxidoreductase alpha subunit